MGSRGAGKQLGQCGWGSPHDVDQQSLVGGNIQAGYCNMSNIWQKNNMTNLRPSLGTRPSKNRKGGSDKLAGVEVYTVPGMQAHF